MAKHKPSPETPAKKGSRSQVSVSYRRIVNYSAGSAVLLLAALGWVSAKQITPAAPLGIFSWELTFTPLTVQQMIESWSEQTRLLAAFGLGLDYFFMLSYAVLLSVLARWLGELLQAKKLGLAKFSRAMFWAAWLAAGLDGVENLGLLDGLVNAPRSPWQETAAACATAKFTLLGLVLLYLLAGWISLRTAHPKRGK